MTEIPIEKLSTRIGKALADHREQSRRTTEALKFAIAWVDATKGEKVTEQGFKEFMGEVRRIEARV